MEDVTTGLHIGRLLDVADVPLCLNGPGLKAHTLIVGQSGSGKSSILGRLLEEIAAKTKARIVIFDPNSDFVKFSEVNESQWKEPWADFDSVDTPTTFHTAWDPLQFNVLTTRDKTDLDLRMNAIVEAPTLSWGRKNALEIARELGFDTRADPDEIAVLNDLEKKDEPFHSLKYGRKELSRVQYALLSKAYLSLSTVWHA